MTFTHTRKPRAVFSAVKSRIAASILMVLIAAVVMIPGMTTYLPFGKLDTIAVPILLFPFIWTGMFIYCFLAEKAWHVWALLSGITLVHGVLSYLALT